MKLVPTEGAEMNRRDFMRTAASYPAVAFTPVRAVPKAISSWQLESPAGSSSVSALRASWIDQRIDERRESAARRVSEYVISRIQGGRYHPPEALFAESSGYQASMAATLSLAGKLLQEPRYIEVASRMFDRLLDARVEDMWSLDWWCPFPTFPSLPFKPEGAEPAGKRPLHDPGALLPGTPLPNHRR